MTALFNRVGDRLLRAVLPQAKAAAVSCWHHCTKCYGTYCIDYYVCWVPYPGYTYCFISAPGSSGTSAFCPSC